MGRDIKVVMGRAPVLVSPKPGPTNTGHTGVLTEVQGNVILSTPGQVYENKSVLNGYISIRAANVTVRNCRVGGASGGNVLIDTGNTACQNALIEYTTLVADYPLTLVDNCVHGHGYTLRYCDLSKTVDGFGMFAYVGDADKNADVVAEFNWVHDLFCWTPDPSHTDYITHSDCIQLHGGGNVIIRGNTLTANPSPESHPDVGGMSCVMVTPDATYGYANAVLIEDNWLDYGSAMLNLNAATNPDTISSVTVRNNKFGRHGTRSAGGNENTVGYPIRIQSALNSPGLRTSDGNDLTNSNVYEDNGSPVYVERV